MEHCCPNSPVTRLGLRCTGSTMPMRAISEPGLLPDQVSVRMSNPIASDMTFSFTATPKIILGE